MTNPKETAPITKDECEVVVSKNYSRKVNLAVIGETYENIDIGSFISIRKVTSEPETWGRGVNLTPLRFKEYVASLVLLRSGSQRLSERP